MAWHKKISTLLIITVLASGNSPVLAQADSEWQTLLKRTQDIFNLSHEYEADTLETQAGRHLVGVYLAIASQDHSLAQARLKDAQLYADTLQDEKFTKTINDMRTLSYSESHKFDALIKVLELSNAPSLESGLKYFRLKRDTPLNVQTPEKPYSLTNSSNNNQRILLEGALNGNPVNLLFDTGGEGSAIFPSFAPDDIIMTDITSRVSGVNNYNFSVTAAKAKELKVGEALFKGPLLSVFENDNVFRGGYILGEQFNMLIGYPEIRGLGHKFSFHVKDNRIDHIKVDPNSAPLVGTQNMFQLTNKLIAELVIDGTSYSCVFDTGATSTFVSEAIFKKYKKSLKLKTLKRKDVKRRGLINMGRNFRYMDQLPITLGGRSFSLKNAVYNTKSNRPSHCLIGLDVIIQSGGGTLDLENLSLSLGPPANISER